MGDIDDILFLINHISLSQKLTAFTSMNPSNRLVHDWLSVTKNLQAA